MTAIAFGAALTKPPAPADVTVAAGSQPSLPQPLSGLRFGEQLRQYLGAESVGKLVVVSVPGETAAGDELVSNELPAEQETASVPSALPDPIALTLPLLPVAHEYAQPVMFAMQPQRSSEAITISATALPLTLRDHSSVNTFNTELVALNAASTPVASALSPLNKGSRVVLAEQASALSVTQLVSQSNPGLAQSLFEAVAQSNVTAPAAATPLSQPLVAQRSALEIALGDRLQVQISQRSEHAVIRLDPPSMGRIEIVIQREAGGIQVHMRASNPDVARQLNGIGDSLRQDLIHRHHGDVSVHVSHDSREQSASQGQRQSNAQREAPGRALSEGDEESAKTFTLAVDEERGV